WRWQYRIHKVRLVTIPQGKIGYVYARDGEALPPSQTLGRVVPCNNFQDARAFLGASGIPSPHPPSPEGRGAENLSPLAPQGRGRGGEGIGQRGRQRAILREGVYALNPALFVVITEDAVYSLRRLQGREEAESVLAWQTRLAEI